METGLGRVRYVVAGLGGLGSDKRIMGMSTRQVKRAISVQAVYTRCRLGRGG